MDEECQYQEQHQQTPQQSSLESVLLLLLRRPGFFFLFDLLLPNLAFHCRVAQPSTALNKATSSIVRVSLATIASSKDLSIVSNPSDFTNTSV